MVNTYYAIGFIAYFGLALPVLLGCIDPIIHFFRRNSTRREDDTRQSAYQFLFRIILALFFFTIPFIPRLIWPSLKGIRIPDR